MYVGAAESNNSTVFAFSQLYNIYRIALQSYLGHKLH